MSLNNDILLSIFMLNVIDSSEEKEKRLITTRFSSQVCRLWRNLILESLTMWGRLILISYPERKAWFEEVLNRAGGSSLLWVQVKWNPPSYTQDLPSSFVVICTRHWDRMEVLDLHMKVWPSFDRSSKQFWTLIAKPTPCLRSATIQTLVGKLPEDIFGNNAPFLTNLECRIHSIKHNHTFLSHIESLYLKPRSIDNLYDVLRWTPCLRILRIGYLNLDRLSDSQCSKLASMAPYILPRLAKIDASLSFKTFNALWCTHSRSPAECFTHHFLHYDGVPLDGHEDQFREAIGNLIDHHHGNNCDAHDIRLALTIKKRSLDIILESTSLQVQLLFNIDNIPAKISEIVLESFMAHMWNIVYFNLHCPGGDKPFGNFAQYCLLLTKVHTITASCVSLRWYNRVERKGVLLFPHLTIVEWVHVVMRDVDIKNMTEFIKRRIEAGWSLPTISIKTYNNIKAICDGLDKLEGLWITWCFDVNQEIVPEREYVCGQSQPLEW